MKTEILVVKNMVCHRCVLTVETALKDLKIPYHEVTVGEIHLCDKPEASKVAELKKELLKTGLELIDSRTGALIEKIKKLVIEKARNDSDEKLHRLNLSTYLTNQIHHDYTYLSSLFSDTEGRTIENYYILQRIEKAKELLVYGHHTLSEIAYKLGYSSVAHLSSQFKKVTGLTPSHFRKIGDNRLKAIDHI